MLKYIAETNTGKARKLLHGNGYSCTETPGSVHAALLKMDAEQGIAGFEKILTAHPDLGLFRAKFTAPRCFLAKELPRLTARDVLILSAALILLSHLSRKLLS